MRTRTQVRRFRRLVACGLMVCYSTSCMSWQVQGLSPQQVVTGEQPESIRVTRPDSTQVVLTEPKVSGDSLTGLTEGRPMSVPLSDISGLAVLRQDSGKMFAIGLATGAVLGAGVLVLMAVANMGGIRPTGRNLVLPYGRAMGEWTDTAGFGRARGSAD
jgi:hypothetical protein